MEAIVMNTPITHSDYELRLVTQLFVAILRKITQAENEDQLRNKTLALRGGPYNEYFFFGFAGSHFWLKQKGYPDRCLVQVHFKPAQP